LAFFFVGAGCGWFPNDAINNLILNEDALGPHWFGIASILMATVGLCSGGLYLAYSIFLPGGMSRTMGRACVTTLISTSLVTLVMMAFFWDVGAPRYPVVVLGTLLSIMVANGTYLFVFALVAIDYGGWLVAPLRTGTDISSLVTTAFGELQNPDGQHNRFPSSVLFGIFAGFVLGGCLAWTAIVQKSLGLRPEAEAEEGRSHEELPTAKRGADEVAPGAARGAPCLRQLLRGFSCPRSLLGPILVGSLADVAQWGIVVSIAEIGARMTDPIGCSGSVGAWVARTSFKANRILVPFGSFISTPLPCSRCMMLLLGCAQIVLTAALLCAALGIFRDAWMTAAGQWAYIVCFGMLGGLEGYLLTMAYRTVGDDEDMPMSTRRSASSLLSFLNVVAVCIAAMVVGSLVSTGAIECTDP